MPPISGIMLLIRWIGQRIKKVKIMTASKEKEVNYTSEMIAEIAAAAPINLEIAKELATKLGKTYRSIIAKAKSEKIVYVSKPAPVKKPKGETKADIVSDIALMVGVASLDGLEKAPATALNRLRANIPVIETDTSDS